MDALIKKTGQRLAENRYRLAPAVSTTCAHERLTDAAKSAGFAVVKLSQPNFIAQSKRCRISRTIWLR